MQSHYPSLSHLGDNEGLSHRYSVILVTFLFYSNMHILCR